MVPNDKGKTRANLRSDESADRDRDLQDGPPSSQRSQTASPTGNAVAYPAPSGSPILRAMLAHGLGLGLIRMGAAKFGQEAAAPQASNSPVVPCLPPIPHSGGFFDGPTDKVEIKGGIINHTHGDYTHVTIHVNSERREVEHDNPRQHPALASGIVAELSDLLSIKPREEDNTPQQHSPRSLPSQTLYHRTAVPSTQGGSISTTIYPTDNSNKIYERHLELKQKGFPLWIPEPNRTLPMSYRRKGVDIGDVGIITPSGAFSFLFNICLPHDDPINPTILPDGFVPIYPPIEQRDIREYSEFKRKNYLASAAIKITKTHDEPPFRGLSFKTSSAEGAVLTFPEGAITRELANVSRFRQYTKANIEEWYRYVNGPLGCEVKNGDVRLVIGCVKATSWGMATVENLSQSHETHYLKYCAVEDTGAPSAPIPLYKWEYMGLAEARVGPDLEEIEDLNRADDSDTALEGKYHNQCLFITTLNPMLSNDAFETINRELGSVLIQESQQFRNGEGDGNLSNSPPNPATLADRAGTAGTDSAIRTGATSESLEAATENLTIGNVVSERVTISRTPNAPTSHPADVLNKLLLQKIPNSRVVITEDEDWCSVIKEDDEIMPSSSEIAERVLATHDIRDEHGAVFLEEKDAPFLCTVPECNSTFTRRSDLKAHLLSHDECKCKGCHEQLTRKVDSTLSPRATPLQSDLYNHWAYLHAQRVMAAAVVDIASFESSLCHQPTPLLLPPNFVSGKKDGRGYQAKRRSYDQNPQLRRMIPELLFSREDGEKHLNTNWSDEDAEFHSFDHSPGFLSFNQTIRKGTATFMSINFRSSSLGKAGLIWNAGLICSLFISAAWQWPSQLDKS